MAGEGKGEPMEESRTQWQRRRAGILLGVLYGLFLAASIASGQDEIDMGRAVFVNSPSDTGRRPATAHIMSIEFRSNGWKVEHDRRTGPNRWPDTAPRFKPDGSGEIEMGALQYTIGLCRHTGAYWTCSSVVQCWWNRIDQGEGVGGFGTGAAPDAIAREWFYDSRWGELAGWQPAYGEEVGVYVAAGDGRNTGATYPGQLAERSDVKRIAWGVNWTRPAEGAGNGSSTGSGESSGGAGGGSGAGAGSNSGGSGTGGGSTGGDAGGGSSVPPLDLSGIAAQLDALGRAVQAVDAHLGQVEKAVNDPPWLQKIGAFLVKNPIGVGILSTVTTVIVQQMRNGGGEPATAAAGQP